jgi:hypothetical protein
MSAAYRKWHIAGLRIYPHMCMFMGRMHLISVILLNHSPSCADKIHTLELEMDHI